MGIEEISSALYAVPTEKPLSDATQTFDTLELVVVELTRSDGATGLGFTYTIGRGAAGILSFLQDTLEPILRGTSGTPRETYRRMRAETTFVGREGVSELAIAAADIALWDAAARRLDIPLYELLGGHRRALPMYDTSGGWLQHTTAELVEHANAAADAGFAGMKMKIGRGPAKDATRVRAVRECLPDDLDVMVDANCGYTADETLRFATLVSDLDIAWIEEPIEKGDISGLARLADRIDVPIATGENFYSPTAFKQTFAADAVDIVQPDVCRVGGITPWLDVASMSRAWEYPVCPHYIEPLHAQLAAGVGGVRFIERHSTVLDSVLEHPPDITNGTITPTTGPGHGIRFSGIEQYHVAD